MSVRDSGRSEGASPSAARPHASRPAIVGSIIAKDVREFTRDRLWLVLTAVGLVIYAVIFYLMPSTVDETITIGLYPADFAESLLALQEGGGEQPEAEEGQGIEVVSFESEDELRDVVSGEKEGTGKQKDVAIGLAFPSDFVERTAAGEKTTVTVYMESGVPAEIREAMSSAIREMAYLVQAAATGDPEAALPVTRPAQDTIILGEDRAGDQIPLQEKVRPMLAFFVLMVESMTLASLVSIEVQHRTVTALLVTPARTSDVLAAKSILGTALAFGQALILLAVTKSFIGEWPVLLVATFLGAIIATGVALVSGSAGKDFLGTLFLGVAFLVPLALPAFTVLFPGTPPVWIRALPTYGVIEAMVGSVSYGRSWGDLAGELASAVAWAAALFAIGLVVLRRKVQSL